MKVRKMMRIKALRTFVYGEYSAEAGEILDVILPKGKELVILGLADLPGDPKTAAELRKKGPTEIRAVRHFGTLSYALAPGETRTVSHEEAQHFVNLGLAEVVDPEKTDVRPGKNLIVEDYSELLKED